MRAVVVLETAKISTTTMTIVNRAKARTTVAALSCSPLRPHNAALTDSLIPCAPASTAWVGVEDVVAAMAAVAVADQEAAMAVTVEAEAVMEAAAVVVVGGRIVLVAGASGLVGQAVLQGLLADESVATVHSVGRRVLPVQHAKLVQHTLDFAALPALPAVNEAFVALGTTLKVAGSQAAFRAVDFTAVVCLAQALRAQGTSKLGVVSAVGASAQSPVFYNRVKGEMEDALKAIGFPTLVVARPSLLAGARENLNQATRPAERISLFVARVLRPLIPANYQAVNASQVASGLLHAVRNRPPGLHVMLSGELQQF